MSLSGQVAFQGWRLFARVSNLGTERGLDWLTYNPVVMWHFHSQAKRDAGPVMSALQEEFPQARTYADVGSGGGGYVAEATRRGIHAVGAEKSPVGRWLTRRQGGRAVPFDLNEDPPAELPRQVDVAYSFEVAEHLPPELGDRLVGFIAGLAPVVVFTAATPGQGGIGHVNEQPHEYWHERFAVAGHRVDHAASARLREALDRRGTHAGWLKLNLYVYRAEAGIESEAQTARNTESASCLIR
jgi:hypothetical protein